jgi:hypothetical protein
MNSKLFERFSSHEDKLLAQYASHPMFTRVREFSDPQFKFIIMQYGEGVSANFVKFLETVLRQVSNPCAVEAIQRILRDEIPQAGPTHQQMRTMSCGKVGITASELVSTVLSDATQTTLKAYFNAVCNQSLWKNRDLALTTFARVIGESLVGVVYKTFTQELVRRFGVTEGDVEFYSFHWHHDEKGGTPFEGGEMGHTEYYDIAIIDLLKTEDDLNEAIEAANLALQIRLSFQDQFLFMLP